MNTLPRHALFVVALVLCLQGCTGEQAAKTSKELDDSRRIVEAGKRRIAELETQLAASQDRATRDKDGPARLAQKLQEQLDAANADLTKERDRHTQLRGEVGSLKKGNLELQTKFDEAKGELEAAKDEAEKTEKDLQEKLKTAQASASAPSEGSGEGLAKETRIKLLGEKAIAEFKARKFESRIKKLEKDLKEKEGQLAQIVNDAEQKDRLVAELSRKVKGLSSTDESRAKEVDARLKGLNDELRKRTAETSRLKRQLDDSEKLLSTFKVGLNDTKKQREAAETELAGIQTQFQEARKQLETALSDLAQQQSGVNQCLERVKQERKRLELCRENTDELRRETNQIKEEAGKLRQEADQTRLARRQDQEEIKSLRAKLHDLSAQFQLLAASPRPSEELEVLSTIEKILPPLGSKEKPNSTPRPTEEPPIAPPREETTDSDLY